MLVVMVRIPIGSEEEGDRMVDRFRNRAGLVDNMPGFLGFELLRGDSELVSTTRWATRGDFDNWMKSQANAEAHGRAPQPTGGGHPRGEREMQHGQDAASASGPPQPAQAQRGNQSSVMVYEVALPEEAGA